MTDRQTNASSGKVVSMFKPKQLLELAQGASMWSNGVLQSCYVDHDIVWRKVVQHISLGIGPESKETRDTHNQAHGQRNPGRIVGDHGKAIHGRFFERAIDQEAIVICW